MYCKKVREFTKACTKTIDLPPIPTLLQKGEIDFAIKMVNDELQELVEAKTITDQADALVDAIYYICDSAVRHGINLDPLFDIVHNANMGKVVDGKVIRREDGKILKPEGWVAPEPLLYEEVKKQCERGSFNED